MSENSEKPADNKILEMLEKRFGTFVANTLFAVVCLAIFVSAVGIIWDFIEPLLRAVERELK